MKSNKSNSLANHFEDKNNRITIFRNAIKEGIESGRAIEFDPNKHVEKLKQLVTKPRT